MIAEFNNDTFQLGYAVYKISIDNQPFYIGMCKHSQLFELPDAKKNSEFLERIKYVEKFTLEIIASGRDEEQLKLLQIFHIHINSPYCNIYGKVAFAKKRVKCLQTHNEFDSIKSAAEFAGCKPDSMSKHLAGRKGYGTLKGLTFERVE